MHTKEQSDAYLKGFKRGRAGKSPFNNPFRSPNSLGQEHMFPRFASELWDAGYFDGYNKWITNQRRILDDLRHSEEPRA